MNGMEPKFSTANENIEKVLVFDTPDKIAGFRLLALKSALGLELKGLKMTRGRSAYSIIKQEFNLTGNKQKVYEQFCALVNTYCFAEHKEA